MTDLLLQHSSYFALVIVLILTARDCPFPRRFPLSPPASSVPTAS